MRNVTLYIPGLFQFVPEFSEDELSHLISLRRFLSFGHASSIPTLGYLDRISELFDLDVNKTEDIPYAAISLLNDEAARPQGSWMRVDPVHLKTSPKGLVLIDSSQFSLSQHDALALAAILNDEFKQLNCKLEVPVPGRWYIQLPNTPQIRTQALPHVAGQGISDFLFKGEQQQVWLQLFNQIQMLLHDCALNEQRLARGEVEINSLWFWGLGELPNEIRRRWSAVYSDDLIVKGLSMLSSAEYRRLDECVFENKLETIQGEYLFVLSDALQSMQYDEPLGWLESVRSVENQYLTPLLSYLKQGVMDQITLVTDSYQIVLKQRDLRWFWKRTRKLKSFFDE